MFKKHIISIAFLWLILACAFFWVFRPFSPEAQLAYQRLVNLNDQAKKEQMADSLPPTQQTREQVSKQIFYKKDMQRLQSRLVSEHSDLIWESKGEGAQLVEHFKGLACAMQEKLMDAAKSEDKENAVPEADLQPKQYMRCLKAQEAVYFYKTGQLQAEKVEVAHYLIPGLLWPFSFDTLDPLFQGRAQKLQLSMFKERNLKAQGFQATFYDWGDEW